MLIIVSLILKQFMDRGSVNKPAKLTITHPPMHKFPDVLAFMKTILQMRQPNNQCSKSCRTLMIAIAELRRYILQSQLRDMLPPTVFSKPV